MNFNSKEDGKKSFSSKTKASIHLSQWGEQICSAQPLKKKILLCESMFIPIEKWNLIIKIIEKKVSLMKPMHQYHLSQSGEYVYGAQSRKGRRLLWESMFIPTDRWTLTLKMLEREGFFYETKAFIHLS